MKKNRYSIFNIIFISLSSLVFLTCSPGSGIIPSDDLPPTELKLVRGGGLTDRSGNYYETVVIGKQEWTTSNLAVTNYKNGKPIVEGEELGDWLGANAGLWTYYGGEKSNNTTYGKLYNGLAVLDENGIAPEGWHVPTLEDWGMLIDYVGGGKEAGGVLKDTINWEEPNLGALNTVGFSAVGGGISNPLERGERFSDLGFEGVYATSELFPAQPASLTIIKFFADRSGVQFAAESIRVGMSVRLVKDR